MTSGIAFDRPDRLGRLRAFPYDRFKIYMIVPTVRIELNSTQAIEVVSGRTFPRVTGDGWRVTGGG